MGGSRDRSFFDFGGRSTPRGVGFRGERLRGQTLTETSPFHALLPVSSSQAEIERIGAREGWRTKLYGRGAPGKPPLFHVIEFWLENPLMLELVPQDKIGAYRDVIQPPRLDAFLAARA